MKTVVIFSGRFHPFHSGHKQVFDHYASKIGPENVYIATSDKRDTVDKPFTFEEKKRMMEMSGVPAQQVHQVASPYRPREITNNLDMDKTTIIFPLGADDKQRFDFKPKQDGTASYMQPYTKGRKQAGSKHAYITALPRFDFEVLGKKINSGTEFRKLYLRSNDKTRKLILANMYGTPQLKNVFDKRLAALNESFLREYIEFISKF